ncbi:hypothetical protein [Niallia sp. 01092]|uniref:hypothetical protein n=1 Tax=unclassified Niallia TaxID=2837522 RepID=UPI003FCF5DA8
MNTIYKTKEDVVQNRELHHFIFNMFGLHSKKKRVQKKLFKQVLEQETLLNKVVEEFHQNEENAQAEVSSSTINFSTLPVTTLLKVGKEFFKEEESVRFYYNKNKPEQYKNKELLIQCISSNFQSCSAETKQKVERFI